MKLSKIIWTQTDEAPALASAALLPIVRAFLKHANIQFESFDISLAGRILACFPEKLLPDQKIPDYLAKLGRIVQLSDANIIKLPNISASVPQLQAAIKELQEKGYSIPDYPERPETLQEQEKQSRYAKVLGSAVNPVIREGNSDRRASAAVKNFARKYPHKMMKAWPLKSVSKTRVAHMEKDDFFGSEMAVTVERPCKVQIEFHTEDGQVSVLKEGIIVDKMDVVDTAVMNINALRTFYEKEMKQAKKEDMLLSLHLKATMMKVSDPVMFSHCVSVFFKDVFEKHDSLINSLEIDLRNGLADMLDKVKTLPDKQRIDVENDIQTTYKNRPRLAMVDSERGITNLHLPNNVIIDASMPNVIRDGGKMWNSDGELQDTVAIIPDRCYAPIYQAVIEDCQAHGQFDPISMGQVSNVGLMAKKAEEYGSHDKTFIASNKGNFYLLDENDQCLMVQSVEKGDIFRMCQTKAVAVRDWVRLAIERTMTTGRPSVFWLDQKRSHDRKIISLVKHYLSEHNIEDLDISIMPPVEAMNLTLKRTRKGEDTIAVTGNVLRDYLTDLFPILELGTSSKMMSIVPLLNGGGLFETGAGGSAPKHVEQFLAEGHLRWNSLGEYCALIPSLELIAHKTNNSKAQIFAKALDQAIEMYLVQGKSPSRRVNEIDNRGATFYLAFFWAKALSNQSDDQEIVKIFSALLREMEINEAEINRQLLDMQNHPVDISGYFFPDPLKVEKQMRPSHTLNRLIDNI